MYRPQYPTNFHMTPLGDVSDDLLGTLESQDSTTGLPLIWELGLGLIGAIVVLSYAGKARKSYSKSSKARARKKLRKARLKAELASL